jgi:hypothetical protein
MVMAAGAAGLHKIAPTPEAEQILKALWNKAVVRTMYLAVAFTASSIPFAASIEWLNANHVAKQRRDAPETVAQGKAEEDGERKDGNVEVQSIS